MALDPHNPYIETLGQVILMFTYLINMWLQAKRNKERKQQTEESEVRVKSSVQQAAKTVTEKTDQQTEQITDAIKTNMRTRVGDLNKKLDGLLGPQSVEEERRKDEPKG